jgi:hypothetical protein
METADILAIRERLLVEIRNEETVHRFVQYRRYYSILIRSTSTNSQPNLLCGNIEAVRRKMH